MGPQSARSYPGRRVVKPAPPKAQRAKQEIDYGRRGKGYVFGAFRPATGEAFTAPYTGRTTANWVNFLGAVEGWINADVERVYAVVDNLNVHSATDVLLFALAHPRWEFVFQPKYAAYLNLIEPWWKILRSVALKGRRFEAWPEIEEAVRRATAYWNEHRLPSSGAVDGGTAPRAAPGSPSCQMPQQLSGCTIKRTEHRLDGPAQRIGVDDVPRGHSDLGGDEQTGRLWQAVFVLQPDPDGADRPAAEEFRQHNGGAIAHDLTLTIEEQ